MRSLRRSEHIDAEQTAAAVLQQGKSRASCNPLSLSVIQMNEGNNQRIVRAIRKPC
jgi:hypothetical protein